eukprot:TRINITY_DN1463_c0_g3_i1.p1 TRINITY_DN1463_c0_g3~~TRINITY_DN1463_c0_g3_i1.p1  ORF type:complete len:564 (+),score=53.44 TRINITY_DN1463_c0_g3_i1:43-1692(+)
MDSMEQLSVFTNLPVVVLRMYLNEKNISAADIVSNGERMVKLMSESESLLEKYKHNIDTKQEKNHTSELEVPNPIVEDFPLIGPKKELMHLQSDYKNPKIIAQPIHDIMDSMEQLSVFTNLPVVVLRMYLNEKNISAADIVSNGERMVKLMSESESLLEKYKHNIDTKQEKNHTSELEVPNPIVEDFPLIGPKKELMHLQSDYKNPKIIAKIKGLEDQGFKYFRSIRGDGNCFYRSVATGLIECMMRDETLYEQLSAIFNHQRLGVDSEIFDEIKKFLDSLGQILATSRPKSYTNSLKKDSSLNSSRDSIDPSSSLSNKFKAPDSEENSVSESMDVVDADNAQTIVNSSIKSAESTDGDATQSHFGHQLLASTNPFAKDVANGAKHTLITFNESSVNNNQSPALSIEKPDEPEIQKASVISENSTLSGSTDINIDKLSEQYATDLKLSQVFVKAFRQLAAHSFLQDPSFAYYLSEQQTIESVRQTALAMGEDAEQLQMIALLSILKIGCRAFQLDRDNNNAWYTLPDETTPPIIFLLFRPGHYDLLYKK